MLVKRQFIHVALSFSKLSICFWENRCVDNVYKRLSHPSAVFIEIFMKLDLPAATLRATPSLVLIYGENPILLFPENSRICRYIERTTDFSPRHFYFKLGLLCFLSHFVITVALRRSVPDFLDFSSTIPDSRKSLRLRLYRKIWDGCEKFGVTIEFEFINIVTTYIDEKSKDANWPFGGNPFRLSNLKCFESIFARGVRIILFVVKIGFQLNAEKEFFNVLLGSKFVGYSNIVYCYNRR